MTSDMLGRLILTALCYVLFHWAFFRYASAVLDRPLLPWWQLVLSYLFNFSLFMVFTRLLLHLCINWTLIWLLLAAEVWLLYRKSFWPCALIGFEGALVGLATNIFTRCAAAILLNRPLAHFDNNMEAGTNIKAYPVSVAFVAAGICFYLLCKNAHVQQRRIILQDSSGTKFYLLLLSILYAFLLLNLTAYYTPGNQLSMKLWGIKSAVFVLIGARVAGYYVWRLSRSKLFQQKLQQERTALLEQKQQSEQIRYLAFTDMLTGCYNRAYAEEMLAELEGTDKAVTLCFLDLDGLKRVNDAYGHSEGDRYLRLAAGLMRECLDDAEEQLFRYGGDEFLLLYVGHTPQQVQARLTALQARLAAFGNTEEYPYPMSISCGVAQRTDGRNLHDALQCADRRMYEQKRARRPAG